MTLTVAEIERWDGGDVREEFHAATSRAKAAFDAADGLATLPAFESWGGEGAEAAKDAIGQTRKDLDAHGNEALSVAQAAGRAKPRVLRLAPSQTESRPYLARLTDAARCSRRSLPW
jgi:hypothetical protein